MTPLSPRQTFALLLCASTTPGRVVEPRRTLLALLRRGLLLRYPATEKIHRCAFILSFRGKRYVAGIERVQESRINERTP